jgi:hypothetical protein
MSMRPVAIASVLLLQHNMEMSRSQRDGGRGGGASGLIALKAGLQEVKRKEDTLA